MGEKVDSGFLLKQKPYFLRRKKTVAQIYEEIFELEQENFREFVVDELLNINAHHKNCPKIDPIPSNFKRDVLFRTIKLTDSYDEIAKKVWVLNCDGHYALLQYNQRVYQITGVRKIQNKNFKSKYDLDSHTNNSLFINVPNSYYSLIFEYIE
jgi:hypothetical protein